jgi:hypothetical protein
VVNPWEAAVPNSVGSPTLLVVSADEIVEFLTMEEEDAVGMLNTVDAPVPKLPWVELPSNPAVIVALL